MKLLFILLIGAACVLGMSMKPNQHSLSTPSEASDDTKCILCGIVVNEVQGFAAENISEADMEKFLKNSTCPIIPDPIRVFCDEMVTFIPEIINNLNNKYPVSTVCVEHGYCTAPFTDLPDPQPVPTYVIDLDLPPNQRWTQICSNETYKAVMGSLLDALEDLFGNSTLLEDLGKTINNYYYPTEYAQEIQGCAAAMGVEYGWLSMVNLGYEVTSACTSIVAQTTEGKIYHVRNMDFWDGIWLTDHLKNITITLDFQKGGKTVFYATSFAGYVGVLSGMKPGAFSVSINTRYYPKNGLKNFFYEIIAAVMEKNNSLVSFLSREVMTNQNDFASAIENLSNDPLIADVYYTVGGVSANQGAVISRNRLNASDVWVLNETHWYEVQTNYDHWTQPPWFDDRVVPAEEAMNAMGQAGVGYEGLFKVLSVKPVLNLQSTFTMLASAADGTYTSLTRWCPYPCAE